MSVQRRNDEMVNLLRPDFFARAEPNASWVHYQSAIMSTCGLHGLWPMSAIHDDGNYIYAVDVATHHDLTCEATPTFGYLSSATVTALPPWCNFVAANSQYLTYGADDAQHDIIGTETYIASNERGLTLGGWFKFTTVPASVFGMMEKWRSAGNQRSYALVKLIGNNIRFAMSTDGINTVSVDSAGAVAADTWYHIYGRFDPSTELAVFIDNVKTTNAVGVPATIFNSTAPFVIAQNDAGNYLNGKASMCHLNSAYLSDGIIQVLWEQSRVMYGK